MIFSKNGAAMTPNSTKKGTMLYRYYISMDVIRNRETGEETLPMRLAAGMVEDAVVTCWREASAVSIYDLCFLAGEAWVGQVGRAVGE